MKYCVCSDREDAQVWNEREEYYMDTLLTQIHIEMAVKPMRVHVTVYVCFGDMVLLRVKIKRGVIKKREKCGVQKCGGIHDQLVSRICLA